jgi:hypothetical protein
MTLNENSIYQTIPGYCRRGLHEMTPENTKVHPNGRWKQCRACLKAARQRDRSKNLEKRSSTVKKWREDNKERVREHKKALYDKIRSEINRLKDGPCLDCGGTFPPCAMDFHHVRGVKKFNVGLAKNLRQLHEEVAKCDLLCACCHRIRTHLSES